MSNQSGSFAADHLQVMSPNEGSNALVPASSGHASGSGMQIDGGPPETLSPIALGPPVTNNTLIQVGQLRVASETVLVPAPAQSDLHLAMASDDRVQEPAMSQIQRVGERFDKNMSEFHEMLRTFFKTWCLHVFKRKRFFEEVSI